jgi:hypothetical protein
MRVNRFSTATEQEECLEIDEKGQRLRWGDERLMINTVNTWQRLVKIWKENMKKIEEKWDGLKKS